MDKSIIKAGLSKLVAEAEVSGEKLTKKVQSISDKSNKAYYKGVAKKMGDYDKDLKKEDDDKIDPVKNNYEGSEKEYHDEMEIRNGQEMIQYDREPSDKFKDRAKKALEGDSTMGNKTYTGKENGNTEEVWGASGGKHIGKEIVKAAASSAKKRAAATPSTTSFGDDIEMNNGKGKNPPARKIATESMKRIKFKAPFDGVANAIKLIPEAFKVNNKEFELTDGNETYRVKWQGTLSEGIAKIISASDKNLISEKFNKIKHLMGYKSEDTLGTPTANDRVNENKNIKAGISQGFTNEVEEIEENCEGIEGQTAPIVAKNNVPHANAEGDMVMNEEEDDDQYDEKQVSGGMEVVDRDASDWEERAFGNNE